MTRALYWTLPFVLLSVVAFGCSEQAAPEREAPATSLSLLSALGMAQGLQHQADELEALGDIDSALTRMERVLEVPFPPDASDGDDMRLDAHGRMAELYLARGDLDGARAAVDRGLGEAERDSYFHARLILTLGRIEQARAHALREEGDEGEARRVSFLAVEALENSIAMNERVLRSLSSESP